MDESEFRDAVLQHAEEGSLRLAPVLREAGFQGPAVEVARGSGGYAAVVMWRRPDGMQIETHVRWHLGIVRYSWGDNAFLHQEYMRVRGRRGEYPGYSDSPDGGFRHLLADLQGEAADVLTLTESQFSEVADAVSASPRRELP